MPHTRSSLLHVPPVWQHPFLNVFRHFKVHEWKRSTKEGDVAAVMVSGPGTWQQEGVALFVWDTSPHHPRVTLVVLPGSFGNTDSHLFLQDKTLKCTVYRIRGSVSASNYIQLPQTSTQSLGLTGRYLYVLFRPMSTKHFVIHLDLSTEVLSSGAGSVHGGSAPLLPPCLLMTTLWPPIPAGQPGHPRVAFQPLQGVQVHSHLASIPLHL